MRHNHKYLKGKKLGMSILLNILITVAQLIGGLISGSLSLLSDALHNFSDVISLFVSYIANLLSKNKYTVEKTFGYKRAEIVAAFINAATLIIIAIYLIYISGKLLFKSLKVLMLFTPSNILISGIK
ncbi:MAG: cation transporter [Bacteroidetes bacterium]|nr:cation transporter [Bacteroidota bacterium]MBL7104002.1 cation transporter [Bacteroidales bacterium]